MLARIARVPLPYWRCSLQSSRHANRASGSRTERHLSPKTCHRFRPIMNDHPSRPIRWPRLPLGWPRLTARSGAGGRPPICQRHAPLPKKPAISSSGRQDHITVMPIRILPSPGRATSGFFPVSEDKRRWRNRGKARASIAMFSAATGENRHSVGQFSPRRSRRGVHRITRSRPCRAIRSALSAGQH